MSKFCFPSLHRSLDSLRHLHRSESGVTAMEYALIAASIALAFVAIAILLGDDVGAMFTNIADSVQDATGGGD